jgi:ferredoxin-NADP reductase
MNERPQNEVLEVVVARRERLADDVAGLTLRRTDGAALPMWEPGAHIDVLFDAPGLGKFIRQYSLCSDPEDYAEWRVAVLGDLGGRGGSRHLYDHIEEGSVLGVRGPRNHFPLGSADPYLFLAGGIGITPILPMVRAAARSSSVWQLHYAGRRRSRMAFLDELKTEHPAHVHVVAEDESGLPDLKGILWDVTPRTAVYCCGPTAMVDAVVLACEELGLPTPHLERFTAPETPPNQMDNRSVEVEFRRLQITRTISENESILDVAEMLGSDIFGSCREGICGTCETRVLEGTPDHRDSVLSEERRANHMMICVSRALSPGLVLDA